ncbi:polyphosphate--glucose phosphotransferase [Intrasporangium calvum]|uniref:Polyphosphate glucokinase n=1 Tax=Intrasporangium calvum (strain ATCC 23552 / DSM 43043 / JCM 3097 / NBRC 12989 / NCIMB 10167 / NRRL B-3866 / 7 KIP) TaxID=710696 RepID=E6SCG9_INTC7|nr:ROK family protein [Intrasporangium calvum]ADU48548.1 Polyphosphate glucokinase [Intrasporangium calvum DSM 43043]AXG13560.1 ROK family protein [Intrasporangium calvum]
MAKKGNPLGIDIGGSGIKGAPVDLDTGALLQKRLRIDTPQPATPDAVAQVVDQIVDAFAEVTGDSPIGVTVPAVVIRGTVRSAANIDPSWVNTDAEALIKEHTGRSVTVLNDADAAGLAELHYGAAKGEKGLVILTTLGTGIGTALIYDGRLIPNSELGHLEIDGYDAEDRAASSVKEIEGLSWDEWIERLQRYYETIEMLFSPDLIVVGGGVSRDSDLFLPKLRLRAPIVPAVLRNKAGIIGAARLASDLAGLTR